MLYEGHIGIPARIQNNTEQIQEPQYNNSQTIQQEPQIENPTQAQGETNSTVEAPADPYENLAKLKKLADQGVISQEEFEKEKAKLLGI